MKLHTTGEVAKRLNISVRTLRYYDQIGLFSPSEKDEHGRRLYTREDLLTLEKITILKKLGLSLNDIRQVLSTVTIKQLLQAHKAALQQKIKELNQSLEHTNTLLNAIHLEGELRWEQLLPLIENVPRAARNWDAYFGKEEQTELRKKLPKMEADDDSIKKWIRFGKRVELCLATGDSPESEEGQMIAEEFLLLSEEMFAGNEELAEKFFEIRRSPAKSRELNLYPIKEEILNFVDQAVQFYEKKISAGSMTGTESPEAVRIK